MPCVRNLMTMWAVNKPSPPVGPSTQLEYYTPRPPTSAPPAVEQWSTVDDAKRVIFKFVLEAESVASRCIERGSLSQPARSLWPALCAGNDVYWWSLDRSCAARKQALALLAAHICVHAASQPVLEDKRGPLVLVVASTVDESVKWFEMCRRCAVEEVGLVVHNVSSGTTPAIPPHRRADVVIGTPHALTEWFSSGHYERSRLSLVVLDHPEVTYATASTLRHAARLGSLLADIPLDAQRVYTSTVNPQMGGAPPLWDALIKVHSGLLLYSSIGSSSSSSPPPSAATSSMGDSGPQLERAAKLHRTEASQGEQQQSTDDKRGMDGNNAVVLLWNIRADDTEGDSLEECAGDMQVTFNRVVVPLQLSASAWAQASASWKQLLPLLQLGALGCWPAAQGVGVGLAFDDKATPLQSRVFNGHPLFMLPSGSVDGVSVDGSREGGRVVASHPHALAAKLPRGLLLRNLASPDELRDATSRAEILSDIRGECEKFGEVASTACWVDPAATGPCLNLELVEYRDTARIVVVFEEALSAAQAFVALHFRQFDGKRVHVALIEGGHTPLDPSHDDPRRVQPLDPLELISAA